MRPNKEWRMAMKKLVVALCLVIVSCLACQTIKKGQEQWSGLTSVEQAAKIDEVLLLTLGDIKDSIDQQYRIYQAAGDQEGIAFIENEIAPLVNAAEEAIDLYHSAVMVWMDSGTEPSDIEVRLRLAQQALDLIEQKLMERAISAFQDAAIEWMRSPEAAHQYEAAKEALFITFGGAS